MAVGSRLRIACILALQLQVGNSLALDLIAPTGAERWPDLLDGSPDMGDIEQTHLRRWRTSRSIHVTQGAFELEPPEELIGEVNVSKTILRMPPVATLFLTLAGGFVALVVGSKLGPFVPRVFVPYIVCIVYVAFSVAIDISIAVQSKPGYEFNPVCAVLLTEGIKLCLSALVYLTSLWGSTRRVIPAEMSASDMGWMALPAGFYAVNNLLVYHAIMQNSMSDFGIFRDTMILWTASMWSFVFKTPLGWIRLMGILIVFIGLVTNKVVSTLSSGAWSWKFSWVLAMTLCNAAGSVANEFALKRNTGLDINIQNMLLYFFCAMFTFVILIFSEPQRLAGSFFSGFTSSTWLTVGLQSIVGLLISRLLKYADSVMKSIATCLRGPLVVLTAPCFTHVAASTTSCLSALVVASGCLVYLTQGPVGATQNAKK